MNKKDGNGDVASSKSMCTYPKENELNMSYNGEADDDNEGSMSAIDAYEDMLNVTAIDESNVKKAVKQCAATKLCVSLDTSAADNYINEEKKRWKPLKGILKKSQSNSVNDVKKKWNFVP